MARLLLNMAFRSITTPIDSLKPLAASKLLFQQGIQYSTRTGADSDTHEDFRSANNIETSDNSLQNFMLQDVKRNPVVIYMKGLPEAPRCGFSALAVKVLQKYEIPIRGRDILGNPELKQCVKSYTNWPTFPQIFIKGEFIGGSDIVLNMHQNGELKNLLSEITGGEQDGAK